METPTMTRKDETMGRLWLCLLAVVVVAGGEKKNCTEDNLLWQVRSALGSPQTKEELAERLIDDRFEYLRSKADYSFRAENGRGVARMIQKARGVPVIDLQASGVNTTALCTFLHKAVPAFRRTEKVEGYVLLSLGSASHGSPFHPAILRRLEATCGLSSSALLELLQEPKLRRWFVSQHFPVVHDGSSRMHARTGPLVGDISTDATWILHKKLHHVPLGVPRVFSTRFQRETAWLDLTTRRDCRRRHVGPYVNFKPRPYREAIVQAVQSRLENRLENAYVGKTKVLERDDGDTREYLSAMLQHRFVLSPPGSGIDCYRHWEAILFGAIPILEYNPLAVELLSHFPALILRNWHDVDDALLDRVWTNAVARPAQFNYETITTAYWQSALLQARSRDPFDASGLGHHHHLLAPPKKTSLLS